VRENVKGIKIISHIYNNKAFDCFSATSTDWNGYGSSNAGVM